MLKEAIEKIVEMAQPNIVSSHGKEYTDKQRTISHRNVLLPDDGDTHPVFYR